jgi:hypothetical protein
LDDLDELDYDS